MKRLQHIFHKKVVPLLSKPSHVIFIGEELRDFLIFLHSYFKDKALLFSRFFETHKNLMVKSVLMRRGKRNRFFLHVSAMVMLICGVIISPLLSESNPFSQNGKGFSFAQGFEGSFSGDDSLTSDDLFKTQESQKPRDKVIIYTVQKADTIGLIGKRFGISEDSIRWENNLTNDNINVDQELRILPVTGLSHKVIRGDSVYSIAKKYNINPQEIVDFPFNDFANPQTFALVEGQMLIVPNGVKPAEKPQPQYVRPRYIATGPVAVSASGIAWPLQGLISQYYSWYHKGIDITSPVGTPIVAAENGTVSEVYTGGWNGGYGIHLIVTGENGVSSLYAHMSAVNVTSGDTVAAGKTIIGWVGLTGRTTGAHLHFEVRGQNGFINPLSVLQ